jgi:hypothetical protein
MTSSLILPFSSKSRMDFLPCSVMLEAREMSFEGRRWEKKAKGKLNFYSSLVPSCAEHWVPSLMSKPRLKLHPSGKCPQTNQVG